MEARELRIGNYLFHENLCKPVIINGDLIADIDNKEYEWQELKPIPLTEEWLLKFSFEFDVEINYAIGVNSVKYYSNKIRLGIEKTGKVDLYYGYQQTIKNIQYVHQLQNLYFALTGEELTLKNKTL